MTVPPGSGGDLLEAIVASTRRTVETREARVPLAELERLCVGHVPRGSAFRSALGTGPHVRVIAECKRRSPSRGVLRAAYDPPRIASAYQAAGAVAVSVLTEPCFFDGALDHLSAVRRVVTTPVLRKDFIVDRYQLFEAVAHGADAVLLIVAALEQHQLAALLGEASGLGLAAVVEVHDATEVARAVDAGADIVGVNNRNLRTLEVSASTSRDLAARLPGHVVAVAESGLKDPSVVAGLALAGYDAFLIGEHFMASPDPGAALADLLGAGRRCLASGSTRADQGVPP